ncbi:MAG: heavy-metal-associated domain-containing protein [Acidimicrobiales bacterium]
MTTQTVSVAGMTCDHCVRAVTAEVSKIAGVERVGVDLSSGSVTIVSREPVDQAALAAAVDEAGYEVVS